jgi:hypothetical protein
MIKWGGKNWRPGSPAKRQPINQSIEELMKPLGEKLHKGNVWQVVMNVPEQTSAPDITPSPTPTNTQTPSVTPTNTNTPTPTITPSETSGACSLYILGAGGSGSNFTWINCNGTPGSIYLPNSDTTEVCGKDGTFTFDGAGSALNMGPCPSPTPTPTNTSTPTNTVTPTKTTTPTVTPTPSRTIITTGFTTTTTWTAPAGISSVTVECWGGGGSGGPTAGALSPSTGGGGAGGAYAKKVLTVIPGVSYTVTVGTGGPSHIGFNGIPGNPSWFSAATVVYAQGGDAGNSPISSGQQGAGAVGSSSSSIGDLVRAGGSGGTGNGSTSGGGGGGAGSSTNGFNATIGTGGSGGTGNPSTGNGANGVSTVGTAGNTGSIYGGGGSGAKSTNSGRASGAGANGYLRLTY